MAVSYIRPMGYGVFMVRPDSIYDDRPEEQYQFPKQYLGRAQEADGSWIVYLEPKKVPGSRGYFAIARVQEIIPDPKAPDMYLAVMEPGSYLAFARPVPFSDQNGPVELGLLNEEGRLSGRAQAAVRPISSEDFLRILEYGLNESDLVPPRLETTGNIPELAEEQAAYAPGIERERIQTLTNRLVRDRVFRRIVLRAYKERCAITGLKFVNGGGRAEVDAAHIRPVEKNGPDIVNNGIALSGTAHWMFDRGLISLSDEFQILISRKVNDVEGVRNFINKTGHAILPERSADWPHPHYLRWHREYCFEI